jgi:hypothetical protein
MIISEFCPDNVCYYGKPLSSLTRDELIKAILEVTETIRNCNGILDRIEQKKAKK